MFKRTMLTISLAAFALSTLFAFEGCAVRDNAAGDAEQAQVRPPPPKPEPKPGPPPTPQPPPHPRPIDTGDPPPPER